MFKSAVGIRLTHGPYKGIALALTDVVPGHLPMTVNDHCAGAAVQVVGEADRVLGLAETGRSGPKSGTYSPLSR